MMVFLTVTLESWSIIMLRVVQVTNFLMVFYFIILVLIGGFFLINLTLAVITIHFIFQQKVTNQRLKEAQQLSLKEKTKSWNISTLKGMGIKRYFEPYHTSLRH